MNIIRELGKRVSMTFMPHRLFSQRRLSRRVTKKTAALRTRVRNIEVSLARLAQIEDELQKASSKKRFKDLDKEEANLESLTGETCGLVSDIVEEVETEMTEGMHAPIIRIKEFVSTVKRLRTRMESQLNSAPLTGPEQKGYEGLEHRQTMNLANYEAMKTRKDYINEILAKMQKARTMDQANAIFAEYNHVFGYPANFKISTEVTKLPPEKRRGVESVRIILRQWIRRYEEMLHQYQVEIARLKKEGAPFKARQEGKKKKLSPKGLMIQAMLNQMQEKLVPQLEALIKDVTHRLRLISSQFRQIKSARNLQDLPRGNALENIDRAAKEADLDLRITRNLEHVDKETRNLRESLEHFTPSETGVTPQFKEQFTAFSDDVLKMVNYIKARTMHDENMLDLCLRMLRLLLLRIQAQQTVLLNLKQEPVAIPVKRLRHDISMVESAARRSASYSLAAAERVENETKPLRHLFEEAA